MAFFDVLQTLLDDLNLTPAELIERTGLQKHNWDWWMQHPDTAPQHKTLRKIRKALGITFYRDPETKEIIGWAVADPNDVKNPIAARTPLTEGANPLEKERNADYNASLPEMSGDDALLNSDEGKMILEYNRLAASYGLRDKWENLSEARRDDWRREYALMQAALRRVQAEHEQRLLEVAVGHREKKPHD